MPDATTDVVLKIGSITGLGMSSINTDDPDSGLGPTARPGTLRILVDAYGYRILQYVKNVSGSAFAMGDLVTKVANTAVNNITAGSVRQATTTGLTANDHDGRLCYVLDNDDTAGAAPEGETSIVKNNSATIIDMEFDMPFSLALAVNDDLVLVSNWQAADAADGNLVVNVLGAVLGNAGFSNNQFGWVQKEGYCPYVRALSGAITAGDPVVADAAQVGAFGTDGQELWVGVALAAASADQTRDRVLVNFKVFTAAGPGTAP